MPDVVTISSGSRIILKGTSDLYLVNKEKISFFFTSADDLYMTGWEYENGMSGKRKDMDKATEFYQMAADKGNSDAKEALRRLNYSRR